MVNGSGSRVRAFPVELGKMVIQDLRGLVIDVMHVDQLYMSDWFPCP